MRFTNASVHKQRMKKTEEFCAKMEAEHPIEEEVVSEKTISETPLVAEPQEHKE